MAITNEPEKPLTATEIKRREKEFWDRETPELNNRLDKVHNEFVRPIIDKCLEILKKHGYIKP